MALSKFNAPSLPNPPAGYDPQYMRQLLGTIELYFSQLDSKTPNFAESYKADMFKGGNLSLSTTETNANYTVVSTDSLILIDATSANVTVTLPTAANSTGAVYTVKKIDSSGNSVIVDGNGSETIDGAANATTSTQYASFTMQCDGTEWWTI